MSLLTEAMEECRFMDKTTRPDGYGGVVTVWVPGAEFSAAIVLDNSTEGRTAAALGAVSLYTITTQKQITLMYGDVIVRLSDGKFFYVTSDGTDDKTPASASLNMRQVSAKELAELPQSGAPNHA